MKLALCIGINDYPGVSNDLYGCRNDAADWTDALTARGFDVRTLLDSAASGAAIRTGVADLLSRTSAGDAVVITYSGHGTWVPDLDGDEPDHRDEALCPHDIAANGPLLDDELFTLFSAASPGVRTVLISDSCHSGTLTRLSRPLGDSRCSSRFLAPSTFLSPPTGNLSRGPSRTRPRSSALLLSACRDTEYSYDATFSGRPNPPSQTCRRPRRTPTGSGRSERTCPARTTRRPRPCRPAPRSSPGPCSPDPPSAHSELPTPPIPGQYRPSDYIDERRRQGGKPANPCAERRDTPDNAHQDRFGYPTRQCMPGRVRQSRGARHAGLRLPPACTSSEIAART
jgi:metacaspase-1